MKFILNLFIYFLTNIYMFFYGKEKIEMKDKSMIHFDTIIDGMKYDCICEEKEYKLKFNKLILTSKSISIYHVTMEEIGTGDVTEGWYPMLGPKCLKDTGYSHHLAIRSHYQLHYKHKQRG